MSRVVPVVGQAAGVLAVLVGLFVVLPLGVALIVGGALVAVTGIALEVAESRPSDRRRRSNGEGGV